MIMRCGVKNIKRMKLLASAIVANSFLMGGYALGADYTSTITPSSPALADNDTVTVSGSAGILSDGSGSVIGDLINPVNDVKVRVTNSDQTDYAGLFAKGNGNKIVLGDRTIIEIDGAKARAVRASDGDVLLGRNTQITATGADARGVYTHLSNSGTHASVVLGSEAHIEVTAVNSAFGIFAEGSTLIKIEDNGVEGSDLYIKVTRTSGSGELRGVRATNSGKIHLGTDATVEVIGNDGLGISANYLGEVRAGEGLKVSVDGDHSKAVVATASGKMYLNGAVIQTEGNDTYALYAQSTSTSHSSLLQGSAGVYEIYGDVFADASAAGQSVIQMNFDSGSYLQGAANFSGTGAAVDYTMKDSRWDMTKDSAVTSLDMDQSDIHFLTGSSYGTLTTSSLSGNGNFYMRADIAGSGGVPAGDLFVVTGSSSGNHQVFVANQGSAAVDGTERLTLVETNDGIAEFATPNVVELGGYQYALHRDPDNPNHWELFGTKIPVFNNDNDLGASNTGNASMNLFRASYLLNYAETQALVKRLGDLREGDEKQKGNVWVRGIGGKFTSAGDSFLRSFDMDYWGIQAGWDKKINREDKKSEVYVGGMLGYSKGSLNYDTGHGSVDSKSLGAYWTHIAPNGFFADATFRYGWMKNEFHVLDSEGHSVHAKDVDSHGFSASLEVGRRYHFDQEAKQGLYIEPQAQLTVGHQSGDSFTASNGLQVKADSYRSVLGRIGTRLGYEVKGGKNPVNVYAKLDWVKEFDGDFGYSFNGSQELTSYQGSWHVWGLGATAQIGDKHNLYLELERATGGRFQQSWAISGGYRFAW